MKLHQKIYEQTRSSKPGLENRTNPNPYDHHNEETWKIFCEWESENPNSDRYQEHIWNQTPELKELNILCLWERKNLIENWSLDYQSITELYINRVFEINSDKIPTVSLKKDKMYTIFGPWKEERTTFNWNLEDGYNSLSKWIVKNISYRPYDMTKPGEERIMLILIVDYILVRKGLKPKNRGGKYGFTYELIDEVEQLYERWINC